MQYLSNSKPEDETDLRELFLMLWAYKSLIAITCVLCTVYAGYYALNAAKEFTSTAIFKLDKSSSNISLDTGAVALANLTGYDSINKSSNLPSDLVNGRIFIEKLDAKLNFQADKYFNSYDPNTIEPTWKSIIKRTIGWQKSSTDIQETIWQGIVKKYNKNVVFDETKNGSIKIEVTHVNPHRAAKIANTIMNELISGTKNKINMEQDERLSYLSNTLAKALSDLEKSQSNLKEFALADSALPLESFAKGSAQLDALREQLNRTSELLDAVATVSLMLENKTTNHDNYLTLRQQFPIVDQVEFRRVLGQNEIISSWNWPDASSVSAVFETLSERKSRLNTQINASQIEAEQLRLKAEAYAKLEREAKIAEATYTVLIEQVKAQSMAAGYRPEKTEIYEYASASINPSAPKHKIILALGAVLGIFLGSALSLVLALSRGVYYSKKSLQIGAQSLRTASFRSLLSLRNKSLKDLDSILVKKPYPVLRELAVEIHKNAATQIVVTSSRTKMKGNDLARALSIYMKSDLIKIAVINFSSKVKKLNIDGEKPYIGSFIVTENAGQLSVLSSDGGLNAIEMLSLRSFWENIQSLNSSFDLVFLCADDNDAISLLSALEGRKTLHISMAKIKKTKFSALIKMRSLLPIQGLLYD